MADDDFKFAQHVANAAYDYDLAHGGNGATASKTYTQTFSLVAHRDDIDRAYGRILAIAVVSEHRFEQEYAEDALRSLDKPLGQQSYVEAK